MMDAALSTRSDDVVKLLADLRIAIQISALQRALMTSTVTKLRAYLTAVSCIMAEEHLTDVSALTWTTVVN